MRTIDDVIVTGKRILVRADLNVPARCREDHLLERAAVRVPR
jgi:3-phosphoglycerate kinase